MAIIESEMINHPQEIISNQEKSPLLKGKQNRQVLPWGANNL